MPELGEIAGAWKDTLERRLGVGGLTEGSWAKEEIEAAQRWERGRYGEMGWISRR